MNRAAFIAPLAVLMLAAPSSAPAVARIGFGELAATAHRASGSAPRAANPCGSSCLEAPAALAPAPRGGAVYAPSAAAATGSARPPQSPVRDHRTERRDAGRQVPGPTAHLHRPVTHRSKTPERNTPATPGMGLLLRISAGDSHELSALIDDPSAAPAHLRRGRAPPCTPASFDLARDPIACAAASAPQVTTARVVSPGTRIPNPPTPAIRSNAPAGREQAVACIAGAGDGAGHRLQPERPSSSRADRRKGATA